MVVALLTPLGVLLWRFPEKSVGRVRFQWLYEPIGLDGTGFSSLTPFIHSFIHSPSTHLTNTLDQSIFFVVDAEVGVVDLVPVVELPGR